MHVESHTVMAVIYNSRYSHTQGGVGWGQCGHVVMVEEEGRWKQRDEHEREMLQQFYTLLLLMIYVKDYVCVCVCNGDKCDKT